MVACLWNIAAQEQYASRILKYSSQAGSKAYAARQVLGAPNALQSGKNPVAWSPAAANLGMEYIEVGFARPMRVQQVAIWENFNPGAIYQIICIESNGKEHKVFQQDKPEKQGQGVRVFRYMMKQTTYEVAAVKLILNTAEVYGLNQIDAIGISSSNQLMEASINIPRDKSYVGKPENLGYSVNSDDPDLLPIISVDGQHLYFARKHHINNIGVNKADDIYVSRRDSHGAWTESINIGPPLNNQYNNFVCAVNPDGSEVLLSGRYDRNGVSQEGLHRTELSNGKWSDPEPIIIESYNNLSAFVCYHVSPDMKYLVIAMEHPNTYGDMDIYVSYRKSNGRYSVPKNLGPTINTAGTEPSVFLSADGKTIYFASDGHPGYGAYDMYMSRRLDNSWTSWSEPINLGPKINTADWDLYYTVPADGEYAYYSSEHNSYGRSDLYRIKLPKDVRPEPVAILKPNFVNIKTNTPIAKINNSNKTIIVQDDSHLNLYEEVKGFYPINESRDLSAELEEEDDFGNQGANTQQESDKELDDKMEDLLARLQELKNEQARSSTIPTNHHDDLEPVSRHAQVEEVTVKPTVIEAKNDLDDRLAALRSDMERINQGQEVEHTYEQDDDGRSYKVKPAYKTSDKASNKEGASNDQMTETLNRYESQEDALSEFERGASVGNVNPRPTYQRSYDLRESSGTDYLEHHQDYRQRLEELKLQKEKAAISAQPMTKYALAKTYIDADVEEELIASSMKNELNDLKQRQAQPELVDPEVEAYRKKLEALKADRDEPAPVSGTRITKEDKSPTNDLVTTGENEDEEVLAFQKKLEEVKSRMNDLPSVGEPEKAPVRIVAEPAFEEAIVEETDVALQTTPEVSKKMARGGKKRVKKEQVGEEAAVEIAEIVQPDISLTSPETVSPTQEIIANEPEISWEETSLADNSELKEVDVELDQKRESIQAMNSEIDQLTDDAEAVRRNKLALEEETDQLAAEREAMEDQKQELQDILAQLETERQEFLDEQKKLESDRKNLEQLRLEQHQRVKSLENEIAALEKEKGLALTAANEMQSSSSLTIDPAAEIFLMPVETGVTVEIRNVFFSANSFYIKPISYKELDKVAAFLRVNNNITVEIGGHTNGMCQTDFCNSLSEKRAKAVSEYIVNKGIPVTRLTYKGYGKQFPIDDNGTPEGRKKNQRVELKIIKVD